MISAGRPFVTENSGTWRKIHVRWLVRAVRARLINSPVSGSPELPSQDIVPVYLNDSEFPWCQWGFSYLYFLSSLLWDQQRTRDVSLWNTKQRERRTHTRIYVIYSKDTPLCRKLNSSVLYNLLHDRECEAIFFFHKTSFSKILNNVKPIIAANYNIDSSEQFMSHV